MEANSLLPELGKAPPYWGWDELEAGSERLSSPVLSFEIQTLEFAPNDAKSTGSFGVSRAALHLPP
ncbi:MAG: hypothetical protein HY647_04110 [Acidobacteria bacterium]|nr:hypothetical protein [Acidobacteriota bacterium]